MLLLPLVILLIYIFSFISLRDSEVRTVLVYLITVVSQIKACRFKVLLASAKNVLTRFRVVVCFQIWNLEVLPLCLSQSLGNPGKE